MLHTDDISAGKDAEENQRICDGFCSFFSDKLTKIAIKISDIIASGTLPLPLQLTHAAPVDFTHFTDISVEEAVRAIKNIPLKSLPLDFIPTTMLKSCADVFGPLIARLANTSFREGIFPDIFKIGQVTPLSKKPGADIEDMAN